MTKQKIIIGLCTADRPKMLAECIASLRVQEIPENMELFLAVVENVENPNSKEFIEQLDFPYELIYIHEPNRGIPIARNKVVDKALEIEADWIAFIDDDETAPKDWIKNLLQEAIKYEADVIHGKVIPIYPKPKPFWILEKENKKTSGDIQKTAATNNTLLSKKLFKDWGLKFDEEMRFTGGEDTDYFNRAYDMGGKIIWSELPVVKEKIPLSRTTYYWKFKRSVRVAFGSVFIKRNHTSYFNGTVYYIPKFFKKLFGGILFLLLFPFSIFFGLKTFKRIGLKTGRYLGYSVGYFLAFLNISPQPYKKIDGE